MLHEQTYAKPIFDDLEAWLKQQLGKISSKTPAAKAIKYALARMPKARLYLENGFLEFGNNTAERAVRPVALGRKNHQLLGLKAGGKSAAIAYTLSETAKMNKVAPEGLACLGARAHPRSCRKPQRRGRKRHLINGSVDAYIESEHLVCSCLFRYLYV